MPKFSEFGKEVKKKLVDIDQTQEWLCREVNLDTGLYIDSAYMSRILTGKLSTPKIVASINRILQLDDSTNTDR